MGFVSAVVARPPRRVLLPLLFAVAGFVLLGTGCDRDETIVKRMPCSTGEYFNVRTGECAFPKSNEEKYSGYLYDRISRDAGEDANKKTEYQVSFAKWLAVQKLADLLDDDRIRSVRRVDFFLPDVMDGWRAPTTVNATQDTQDNKAAVLSAEKKMYLDLSGALSDIVPILDESANEHSARVAVVRILSTPESMASFWLEHSETVRFVQTISGPADELQRPFEPEEATP